MKAGRTKDLLRRAVATYIKQFVIASNELGAAELVRRFLDCSIKEAYELTKDAIKFDDDLRRKFYP